MTFSFRAPDTVYASGEIVSGDATKFIALPPFKTLELESPGGLVGEALKIAAELDRRGGIRTVVRSGASCASACAAVLFASGQTRVLEMGGRLGFHSCYRADGSAFELCNETIVSNATQHGVPWGSVEQFMKGVAPDKILWLGAEEAECWKLTKASPGSHEDFTGCLMSTHYRAGLKTHGKPFSPRDVSAKNADYDACRFNAGTSYTHVPNPNTKGQGFSAAFRKICTSVVQDPKTPKYAAIDILLWLTMTDPDVLALKPIALTARLIGDGKQIARCWKCWSIWGQTAMMLGEPKTAVQYFEVSARLAVEEGFGVPKWLDYQTEIAKNAASKKG